MKTIEEASIEYVKSNFLLETIWAQETQDAFKSGVEFAQRWTPVEEELPPLDVPVICKYSMFGKEYHWTGTFYTKERVMHFIKKHLKITHWRPINVK